MTTIFRKGADLTNRMLGKVGLQLTSTHIRSVDFRSVTDDPLEGYYRSNGSAFVVEVPIDVCRIYLLGGAGAENPLVETASAYDRGVCISYTGSPLETYYAYWQPSTIAEAVGVRPVLATKHLLSRPHHTPPVPWKEGSSGSRRASRLTREGFRQAGEKLGVPDESIEGLIYFGPVNEPFGRVTFYRLTSLCESIKKHGFAPEENGGHIEAKILARGQECRPLVSSGKHRIAALSALGYTRIPLVFGGKKQPVIIRREDVPSWPNVQAGLFTADQARAVFDRTFDGVMPCWVTEANGRGHSIPRS